MAAVHSVQTKDQKLEARALDPARATLRLDVRTPTSEAARASTHPAPTRGALERELDRVQAAVQAHEVTFGQQLIWLVLSQALFLNAYLMVLIFGSGSMVAGRRWLLAGLAIFSVGFALFAYIALRGNRDAGQALRATRREIEAALVKFGRAPVFAPPNVISAHLASFAAGLLPHMVIVGWLAISMYALATPNQPPSVLESSQATTPTSQEGKARGPQSITDSKSASQPNQPTHSEPQPQSPQRTGFKW